MGGHVLKIHVYLLKPASLTEIQIVTTIYD